MMKVSVVNLKGGSGKTVSSFHLATAFAVRGRTLLADCDEQGSALSWASAIEEDGGEVGFSVMGLPVKDVNRRIRDFEADYEYVVMDTPPGDYMVARSAIMAADVAVLVVPPTPIDLDRVMPTLELIADVEDMTGLTYYVLLTRVRRISREGQDTRGAMAEMELPLLEAEIPLLGRYSDSFGQPIRDLGEYERVARELLGEREEVVR